MGGGALAPLVTVGNAADLETQRCIAYALCNLAADTVHRAAIVNEGGLPPLISLACSDDANDMKAAVSTIRGLSASPDARRQIVVAGALEALSNATSSVTEATFTITDPTLASMIAVETGDTVVYEIGFWVTAVLTIITIVALVAWRKRMRHAIQLIPMVRQDLRSARIRRLAQPLHF